MIEPKPLKLKDRKRAAILAATISEFKKDGFSGTSMDRIAEVAKVSKRTVYNHFSSKEELFQAIIAEVLGRMGKIEAFPYDATQDLQPQVHAIGKRIAQATMNEDFVTLARILISRFTQVPDLASATFMNADQRKETLEQWLDDAVRDHRLDIEEVPNAATEYLGLIESFGFWPQVVGLKPFLGEDEMDEVIRRSTAMFLCRYEIPKK